MSLTQIGNLQHSRNINCAGMEYAATEDPQQSVEDFLIDAGAENVQVYDGKTRIAGAKIEFKVFEPEHPTEETPIHLRNGFFGAGAAYFGLAAALAKRGRRTVVAECVRDQYDWDTFAPNPLLLPALAGYGVIKYTNKIFGTRQADIVAHSMGGPTTSLLGKKHPEVIRSVSYTGAAGHDGKNTVWQRAKTLPKVGKLEIAPNIVPLREEYDPERSMLLDAVVYGSRPIRTLREAIAVARVDDKPRVMALRSQGTRTGEVIMEDDCFFDPDNIIHHMDGSYDALTVIKNALHIDPNINPDTHAEVQIEMFNRLNFVPALKSAG